MMLISVRTSNQSDTTRLWDLLVSETGAMKNFIKSADMLVMMAISMQVMIFNN